MTEFDPSQLLNYLRLNWLEGLLVISSMTKWLGTFPNLGIMGEIN